MSVENYQDRILTCRDCGQDFTFSAGEQEFYASRGLTNLPGRCPGCRAARRSGRGQSFAPRSRGEQFETTCASCGKKTTVPFVPREGRPVYCSDCFQPERASRVPAAIAHIAIVIAVTVMAKAIPVSGMVTDAIAAIAAGKIL